MQNPDVKDLMVELQTDNCNQFSLLDTMQFVRNRVRPRSEDFCNTIEQVLKLTADDAIKHYFGLYLLKLFNVIPNELASNHRKLAYLNMLFYAISCKKEIIENNCKLSKKSSKFGYAAMFWLGKYHSLEDPEQLNIRHFEKLEALLRMYCLASHGIFNLLNYPEYDNFMRTALESAKLAKAPLLIRFVYIWNMLRCYIRVNIKQLIDDSRPCPFPNPHGLYLGNSEMMNMKLCMELGCKMMNVNIGQAFQVMKSILHCGCGCDKGINLSNLRFLERSVVLHVLSCC